MSSESNPTAAEAASFALAQEMPRAEAQTLVKAAAQRAVAEDRALADCLAEATETAIDWTALMAPDAHLDAAEAIIDEILARAAARRA